MIKFSPSMLYSPLHSPEEAFTTAFSLGEVKKASILVYSSMEDVIPMLKSLLSTLDAYNIEANIMCYGMLPESIEARGRVKLGFYGKHDFSFFGSPKSVHLKDFIDTPTDIFIDMTSCNRPRIKKIRERVKCHLSIGINPAPDTNFDFCYTIPPHIDIHIEDVFSPMMRYLGLINK